MGSLGCGTLSICRPNEKKGPEAQCCLVQPIFRLSASSNVEYLLAIERLFVSRTNSTLERQSECITTTPKA